MCEDCRLNNESVSEMTHLYEENWQNWQTILPQIKRVATYCSYCKNPLSFWRTADVSDVTTASQTMSLMAVCVLSRARSVTTVPDICQIGMNTPPFCPWKATTDQTFSTQSSPITPNLLLPSPSPPCRVSWGCMQTLFSLLECEWAEAHDDSPREQM